LADSGVVGARLGPSALRALTHEPWPGNVRELRNVVVQAALRAVDVPIDASHVAEVLAARTNARHRPTPNEARRILAETGNNMSETARRTGLARSTLRDLLRTGR